MLVMNLFIDEICSKRLSFPVSKASQPLLRCVLQDVKKILGLGEDQSDRARSLFFFIGKSAQW